jgi:EAL domain-containing protein (putative c-di-GMP-specific phosphodiesterase class I)
MCGTALLRFQLLRSCRTSQLGVTARKIDFIRDMADHDDSLAIVRAVVAMSSSLCIGTTAEGVETYQQLERLKSEGCTEAQGYLFSPPRSAADVKIWLATLTPEAETGSPLGRFGGT